MINQSTELTKEMIILAKKSGILDKIYGEEVNRLIRKKYTASEEFALIWASTTGEKAEEVAAFIAYREECKKTVSDLIAKLSM